MQPLMGVLLSVAKGTSTVTESVWDNRFRYVTSCARWARMSRWTVRWPCSRAWKSCLPLAPRFRPARRCSDGRCSLMADGTSEIEEIGHIERGYENIVEKLRGLGADIRKVERMPVALEQAL